MHFEVFEGSNNAKTFENFLIKLEAKCTGRTIAILDNLKVHQAKLLESVYDHNFKEMFLPPYSCELNPI